MFDENDLMQKIMHADTSDMLHIYKNNIMAARISALTDIYTQTAQFLGEDFMKAVAGEYAKTHHNKGSNLNLYGADFGLFLSQFPQCHNFPYLHDLCHYEYQMRKLSYAASETHVTLQDIAAGQEIHHISKATYMMISEYDILNLSDFIAGTIKQPNLEKSLYYNILYRDPKTWNIYTVPATKEQAEIFPALYSKDVSALTEEMMAQENIANFVTFLMQKHLFIK